MGKGDSWRKALLEAETVDDKISRNVLYNPDGTLAQIVEKVTPQELPAAVTETVKRQYASASVRAASKVTHAEIVEYSLSLSGGAPKKIVVSADGTIASTEGETALDAIRSQPPAVVSPRLTDQQDGSRAQ